MINVIFVIVIIKIDCGILKRLIDKNFQIKEFLFVKL